MQRREFIAGLGSAAATWPVIAGAQQAVKVARIGVIGPRPEDAGFGAGYAAMLDELRKLGFIEGHNLAVEYRSVEQEPGAIIADVAALVRSNVDVLVAIGNEAPLQAAVAANSAIPIVFAAVNYDPIARGYVKGLATPGTLATGIFLRQPELAEKQVELLTQAFPDRSRLGVLWDATSGDQFSAAESQAKRRRLEVSALKLENPPYDFDTAFRSLAQSRPQMLLAAAGPYFIRARQQIAELAIQYRLPSMFMFKAYVDAGGLMSYGVDALLPFRRVGYYVGKIIRGAKPADLPVEQPTTFEMAINLKTAKALGIELPLATLLSADVVFE
jgi:putative tryptophan/tyrosine transport system substrate-binding protein